MDVLNQFRLYMTRPLVRPLALAAPILVLLICLPLLRPLRHPDPTKISDDELARLATVQSLVENRTLAIDHSTFTPTSGTVRIGRKTYSDQPPTLAALLAAPYWMMQRFGLSFQHNPSLVEFLLTLIGVTLPVSLAAGMLYRMGRLFELPRWKRAALAAAVTLGSGLISYAVVLNAHAPAAALVLAAVVALVNVSISHRPTRTGGWLAAAGLLAGLAVAIEPLAILFLPFLIATIALMRWRPTMRIGGVLLFLIGLTPALVLHAVTTIPITGDLRPIALHPELSQSRTLATSAATFDEDGELITLRSGLASARRLADATLGQHGAFSHFPIIILGIFGIAAVMHRHWPATTKLLAASVATVALTILILSCFITRTGPGETFAAANFIVFLPFLAFWSGAWIRRPHGPIKWTLAAVAVAFSIAVSLIGATNPTPRTGYPTYTATAALNQLIHPHPDNGPTVLANR